MLHEIDWIFHWKFADWFKLFTCLDTCYFNTDMCKFESSPNDESRTHSAHTLKAYSKLRAYGCLLLCRESHITHSRRYNHPWSSEEGGKGGRPSWILQFSVKKLTYIFSVLSGNNKFHHFWPSLQKIPWWPLWKNLSNAHGYNYNNNSFLLRTCGPYHIHNHKHKSIING